MMNPLLLSGWYNNLIRNKITGSLIIFAAYIIQQVVEKEDRPPSVKLKTLLSGKTKNARETKTRYFQQRDYRTVAHKRHQAKSKHTSEICALETIQLKQSTFYCFLFLFEHLNIFGHSKHPSELLLHSLL